MTTPAEDPFTRDIRSDLERIDSVMTQIIKNPATCAEFIRDPSGVLASLGLHPPASRGTHDRVNRIFYAVLTNTELLELVRNHYASPAFQSAVEPHVNDHLRIVREGLSQGALRASIQYDLAAADHAFRQPEFLRQVYRITLRDLNERRLLQQAYTTEQIDDYVDRLVESIQQRLPIREHPKLEVWEPPHYGIGTGYAFGQIEVPVEATLPIAVEFIATITIPVAVGMQEAVNDMASGGLRIDSESAQTLTTAGALMKLAGDMLSYANNFERR